MAGVNIRANMAGAKMEVKLVENIGSFFFRTSTVKETVPVLQKKEPMAEKEKALLEKSWSRRTRRWRRRTRR